MTASSQGGASRSKALPWSMSKTARPFGCGPSPSLDQASAAGPRNDCRNACLPSLSRKALGGSVCVPP
eukprot:12174986-Alexandrium_andersonii.AAC.1